MDIEDKELFESALTDEAPEIEATPAEPEPQIEGQPRDESGRFASKAQDEPQPEPEPQAVEPPAKEEANVPSWRLREVREEADRRVAEMQRQFEQQLQRQQPKPEPVAPPDVFENPNGFLEHGVRQAVDPIASQVTQLREEYSRKWAVKEHGAEKVKAAYDAIAQGIQSSDPEVMATYQRAMNSMDPFGDIVAWHQQKSVYQQIGNDPKAWASKWLDEQLSDPKFAGEIMQKIQQSARAPAAQGQSKIALPPSLSKVAGAQVASDDDNDVSDGALFRHALR